ncbi:MAG: FHA domain-containing protein [Planctomycetaceae bacterium]|jgi:adenylate cyclase|nr:FHA domain-containing protein [Planctomycetaceae bacterium]
MFGVLVPVGGGDLINLERRDLVIGRKDSCDVVLRFDNVSGRHCRLVLSAGYWYVVDLNSSNGVKVNNVKTQDRRLDPGDVLAVAKHEFTIKYDPARNGATDEKPPLMFQEAEIMTQSLMEKIGLQKPKQKQDESTRTELNKNIKDEFNIENDDDENNENEIENEIENAEKIKQQGKKNYFNDLKFD